MFALARLSVSPEALPVAWHALGKALRLSDGDLIARGTDSDELIVYLNDISRRHARDLLERVTSSDPRLEEVGIEIAHYPVDADRIDGMAEGAGIGVRTRCARRADEWLADAAPILSGSSHWLLRWWPLAHSRSR